MNLLTFQVQLSERFYKMVLPTVRRNTFVKPEGKTYVDIISKAYVYSGLLLGVNRFPIISEKRMLIALFYVYSLTLNGIISYFVITMPLENNIFLPLRASRYCQYELSVLLSLFIWKRFYCFYKELANFDNEVGCRPKFLKGSIALSVLFGIISAVFAFIFPKQRTGVFLYAPFHLIATFENFYFGHLIDLLTTRMRLLNYYLEYSTSIPKTESSPKIFEFVFFEHDSRRFYFPNMGKMMELYQTIIAAHKFLVDAVKWLVSI